MPGSAMALMEENRAKEEERIRKEKEEKERKERKKDPKAKKAEVERRAR
jgi:hypothetical protein